MVKSFKELVEENGDRIVYYRYGTMGKVYVKTFDYSVYYGGAYDSFEYYNDYFVELGDNSLERKKEIEKK